MYEEKLQEIKESLRGNETLYFHCGASLNKDKNDHSNGLLAITDQRLLFQEEAKEITLSLELHEITQSEKTRNLGFVYLGISTEKLSLSFMVRKAEIDELLKTVEKATSQARIAQRFGGNTKDEVPVISFEEANNEQLRSKLQLDKWFAEMETQDDVTLYSFVEDSYNGQAANMSRLQSFLSRGWEFVGMTVIASDVGPGMRETHIIVKWPKKAE